MSTRREPPQGDPADGNGRTGDDPLGDASGHDDHTRDPGSPAPADGPADDSDDVDAIFAAMVADLDDPPAADDARHAFPVQWPSELTSTGRLLHVSPEPEPERPELAEDDPFAGGYGEFIAPDPDIPVDGDPLRVTGWILVAVGLTATVLGVIFRSIFPAASATVGVTTLIAGVGLLLWRMPRDRDDDDPGAVV